MGKVFLVGPDRAIPELLTRNAARVLGAADVVLFDSLVSAEVLQLVSPTADSGVWKARRLEVAHAGRN